MSRKNQMSGIIGKFLDARRVNSCNAPSLAWGLETAAAIFFTKNAYVTFIAGVPFSIINDEKNWRLYCFLGQL